MNSPIISIKDLSKSYEGSEVLKGLNWEIEQGDIVALLGKNGAGKSTLLETIMKLRDADKGSLEIWGNSWETLNQQQKEKIGFVAQDIKGYEWMSVTNFLNYLGGFFPSFDKAYCEQLQSR
ncbi:MAG: ATP-binding cassette domain-containing protein, partial [Kangiellaceae bacterium]|nr:ATP-binding cassette domain-containing protein [Kangiellaceae bacterium]